MSASFTLKVGTVEIQCSGTEEYLKEQVQIVLDYVEPFLSNAVSASTNDESGGNGSSPANGNGELTPLSVNSIAAKLDVKTGSDLILAACASLMRRGSETFPRKSILQEMKAATSYYNANMGSNMTAGLKTLITNQRLLEQASDVYAFPASVRKEFEAKLAHE